MKRWLAAFALPAILVALPAYAADDAAVARGAYIFAAADCAACHTDAKDHGAPLAGGRALITPFGTFYTPNITPDPVHGIGKWSLADFRRALRDGEGRDGGYLYPVFPFAAYSRMSDGDVADLYVYLMTQKPSPTPNKPDQIKFPFEFRSLLFGWRLLYFKEGPLPPVSGKNPEWNRGRYLAEAVVHCQECHTPRDALGGLEPSHAYAGNPNGPDGLRSPNITPDNDTGIGQWSVADFAKLLKTGETPDFDTVGKQMGEVVKGTAMLTDSDRQAIAVYLKSLPPLHATPRN
jgi:mono/diheme cytochrome c family protein